MTTEAERLEALRREMLLMEQRRAMESRAAEIAAQPAPAAPTGGVTANPEAVADLRENRIPAAATGFRDTLMFGLADEARGVMGAIDPNDTYQAARDDERYRQALAAHEYPGSYTTGQIAGGVTAGALTAGPLDDALRAIPRLGGSGTGARIGRGVLAGGLEGGAYGFGSGEGFDDRFTQTLTYGGLGAGAGAAATGATEIARRLLLRPVGGALGVGNQARAGNTVVRALEDAGYTPQQIDDALRAAAAEGQDVFNVADVLGVAGRRTLAGAASQPGPARVLADEALTSRQNNQTTRLAEFVEEAMDARNTRAQQAAAATVERGAAGNVNYGAARANAQPVDVRGVLAAIDDQIGPMRNTTIAGEGVDARLDGIRRRLAGTLTEGGEVMPAEMSDLSRLIRLYGEISDDIQAATRAGRGFEAGQLRNVQSALGEALEEASPDWRSANANFAGASRVVDAPDQGAAANRRTVRSADVADQWSDIEARINRIPGLTDAERAQYIEEARQGFRIGYANSDLAAIEGARDTRNMAGALFQNNRQRENYGLMAADPDLFFRRVGRESDMSETRNAVLGGSRTAELLADQDMVNGEDVGIIANLLQGRAVAAGGQVAGRALQAASGTNEATREMIARALLSNNPGDMQRLLASARQGESARRIVEAMMRGASRGPLGQVAAR